MLPTVVFLAFCALSNAQYYDTLTANSITEEEYERREQDEDLTFCAINVKDCTEDEGRRVDGSCNNPRYPIRGAAYTPWLRILPPIFDGDDGLRKAKSGKPLPLPRRVRTTLLCEGPAYHCRYNALITSFFLFVTVDVAFPHEAEYLISDKRDCCKGIGDTKMCAPNVVPDDDPVLRFSGYRCINMSKPFTYVTSGCVKSEPTHSRVNKATPLADLSVVYGSNPIKALKARAREGGRLKVEIENDMVWPPSIKDNPWADCILNEPNETRCHDSPEGGVNGLMPLNMVFLWFWRQHNFIASNLARVNPCWDDNKLYHTARDILISIYLQIFYYELMPLFLGRDYMIDHKIISSHPSFRDMYDETLYPQITLEYVYTMRWVHTLQPGTMLMYDEDGNYVKQIPVSNLTDRTGYMPKNIGILTQGVIRQPCADNDQKVDPIMAEMAYGAAQQIIDVLTNDDMKARFEGHQPYVKFLEHCTGKDYSSFEDLYDVITKQNVKLLESVYDNVEDIDLIAGVWMEKPIKGGIAPPTFACLVGNQLKRNIVTDRHWYERENRPNAFTAGKLVNIADKLGREEPLDAGGPESYAVEVKEAGLAQLMEIRKATIARILCDSGDTISEIQPQAFRLPGPGNEMVSCDDIEDINYDVWQDEDCLPCDFDE